MSNDFGLYAGRWIAVINNRVVGQGGTPEQALQAASITRYKETPYISYVPTKNPLTFSPIFNRVRGLLLDDVKVYLVGGALRDALLSRPIHDYDIILSENSLELARKVADHFGGVFFLLDEERQTARVILNDNNGIMTTFDFAAIRGNDLESDLKERDFTVNAIASSLNEPDKLLDPMAGSTDLFNSVLRACSNTSFTSDPVRILRAIRLAAGYELKILPKTRSLMTGAVSFLEHVSPERLRDELFRILAGPKPAKSILALDILGTLPYLLPELISLRDVKQSPPHIKNVWLHTLDTLNYLEKIISVLENLPDDFPSMEINEHLIKDEKVKDKQNLIFHHFEIRLGRFRDEILTLMSKELVLNRPVRSLVFFAALYHDSGKPQVKTIDKEGRFRFFNHEELGSDLIEKRGTALRLSNEEINRVRLIVKGHMRPTHLAHLEKEPTPRTIYRFFRDFKETGIDICLLSLADLLATYGPAIPQERWIKQIAVVEQLLNAWWKDPEKEIKPVSLIRGNDLLVEFDLKPGPIIGHLLELIREEQVEGNLKTREDAFLFIKRLLDTQYQKN